MPLFVILCQDKPGALQRRLDNREAHLAYLRSQPGLKVAGPCLNAAGEMNGSMLVYEADDEAGVRAFVDNDPFNKADVFEPVEIRPWRHSVGSLP